MQVQRVQNNSYIQNNGYNSKNSYNPAFGMNFRCSEEFSRRLGGKGRAYFNKYLDKIKKIVAEIPGQALFEISNNPKKTVQEILDEAFARAMYLKDGVQK